MDSQIINRRGTVYKEGGSWRPEKPRSHPMRHSKDGLSGTCGF